MVRLTTRRGVLTGAMLGALCTALPTVVRPQARRITRITIGANPAGTNFNLVAGGFAKTLQQSLQIPSTVRPYSGSSAYIPLLQRGEITLGINSSIDSYLSFTGQTPYSAAMTNLRGFMSVYPLAYMFWVRASSGLRRIEDLRGKRVVLDYRGLVPLGRLNRAILATGGLTESDVVASTAAGLGEGARIVAEGRADAVAMGYRLPLVAQTHATMSGGLRFLALGSDESKVAEIMPGAGVTTVLPGEQVVGIDEPTRFAVYDTYLTGGLHIGNDDAHRIVAALYDGWEVLRRDYLVLAPVEKASLAPADPPLPYHDGAIAYFREQGVWSAAHERNQVRLLG